jgi:hypothetical protein
MRWQWPKDETHRLILATVVLLGIGALIFDPIIFPSNWDNAILSEAGKAFVIAGILGFTIEPWLRRAFARDVFSAAFGYHMPDDFKQEIAKISSYRLICIKHIMNIRIRNIDDKHVSINVIIERTFKNFGADAREFRTSILIDEWSVPNNRSEIARCEIFTQDGECKQFLPSEVKYYPNLSFEAESPPIKLRRDGEATGIVEYNVYGNKNDFIYEQFMNPTRNAEINVLEQPDDIEVEADFGAGHLRRTGIKGGYELDGVYFPPIPMKVRWWPKTDAAQWPVNAPHPSTL